VYALGHGIEPESHQKRVMSNLRPQVEKIFQEQEYLPTSAAYLFAKPQEEILELPTYVLSSWIFKAKIRIQRLQKQRKKATTSKTNPSLFHYIRNQSVNAAKKKTSS
jgi:hypothetical protein